MESPESLVPCQKGTTDDALAKKSNPATNYRSFPDAAVLLDKRRKKANAYSTQLAEKWLFCCNEKK